MFTVEEICEEQERQYNQLMQEDDQYCHPESFKWGFEHGFEYALSKLGWHPTSENKIYAITHCSFEFDDVGYPSLEPIKFFITQEKRDKAFEEIVAKKLQWFEKCKADHLKYYGYFSTEDEYLVNINDGDTLEIFMGKWCYEWGKEEYKIEEEE